MILLCLFHFREPLKIDVSGKVFSMILSCWVITSIFLWFSRNYNLLVLIAFIFFCKPLLSHCIVISGWCTFNLFKWEYFPFWLWLKNALHMLIMDILLCIASFIAIPILRMKLLLRIALQLGRCWQGWPKLHFTSYNTWFIWINKNNTEFPVAKKLFEMNGLTMVMFTYSETE